mgnify:CR=1 FL=1
MKAFYCCLIFYCFFNLQCTQANDKLVTAIAAIMEEENETKHFSGSVVVGLQEHILFKENFGYANRQTKRTIVEDTYFDIASINKSFIAALILLAVEEGKLDLNTKLIAQLNNYSYTGTFHPHINIHHLLSHTAGLGDYQHIDKELAANNFTAFKSMHFDNASYVDFISRVPSFHTPGEHYYYSNFGYHLLCIILEDIYQKSFADLLDEKICKPYGFQHLFSPKSRVGLNEIAAEGYNLVDNKWVPNMYIDLSLGRRIYASATDLYQWGLLVKKVGVLQQKSFDMMFSNHLEGISKEYTYGYGWAVHENGDELAPGNIGIQESYIIHGGQTDGFKSILILLDNGYQISLLSNSGNQTAIMDLSQKLVKTIIENEK